MCLKLESPLRKFYGGHYDFVNRYGMNICVTNDHGYCPFVVSTSLLLNGLKTRVTRRVPLVEQALLSLPEHLSSHPVFSGVRVTRSLVLCVCFVDRWLSFCAFFWPLYCLFFFDLWILITPFVSSNSSYHTLDVITPQYDDG